MTRAALRAISFENHMKKSSVLNEGHGRQVTGPENTYGPARKAYWSMQGSLRPKNSKTHRSYDKMLIDWVRSGRTGKYMDYGQDAKYFPVQPNLVNKYVVLTERRPSV